MPSLTVIYPSLIASLTAHLMRSSLMPVNSSSCLSVRLARSVCQLQVERTTATTNRTTSGSILTIHAINQRGNRVYGVDGCFLPIFCLLCKPLMGGNLLFHERHSLCQLLM